MPSLKSNSKVANGCGSLFAAVWILGWSAGTLAFDGMWLYSSYKQLVALSYPTAPAIITHSAVAPNDESTRLDLKFKFTVAGREHTGQKHRYNEMASNDGWAEKEISKYPVGAPVTAHYNPSNPSDAVLAVGMDGCDLFMLMFMTPFNVIMLGSWALAWTVLRGARADSPAAGLTVIDRGTDLSVRVPEFPPSAIVGIALLATSFVMIFVVGFSAGFHPSLEVMAVVWSIILGIAGFAYFKLAKPSWGGDRDLRIDWMTRRLTLPQTFGRTEPIEVPLEKITGIAVENHAASAMRLKPAPHTSGVSLYYRNDRGSTDSARLVEFSDEARSNAFADWLRAKLKSENRLGA